LLDTWQKIKLPLPGKKRLKFITKRKKKSKQGLESRQEPPTVHEAEFVKANVTAVLRNLELSDLLKDAWFIQHRRVTKLVAIEEKLGYSLPDGPKNIEALATILGLMIKHETATTLLLRKTGGMSAAIDMEKLSPAAQEIAQLDDVDRNLIQQLSHKWLERIQEGVADAAKAEGLAANGSGTKGRIPGNNEGNNGTTIPGRA